MHIVGVSFDSPADNLAWAQDEGFQYDLWSDLDRTLALYYGAAESAEDPKPIRLSVLLDTDGAVLLEYDVGSGFGTHPAEVLEDCQALFGDR